MTRRTGRSKRAASAVRFDCAGLNCAWKVDERRLDLDVHHLLGVLEHEIRGPTLRVPNRDLRRHVPDCVCLLGDLLRDLQLRRVTEPAAGDRVELECQLVIARCRDSRQDVDRRVRFAQLDLAYDFDFGAFGDPDAILGRDGGIAGTWRIAAIVDMVSYLLFAPAALYLHGRFMAIASEPARQAWVVRVVTASGLGFVLIGAIGAVLMASVGPPLIEIGLTDPDAARIPFQALVNAVGVGLWGTLELLLLGGWLLGLAWFVRGEDRLLSTAATIAAAGVVGYAAKAGLTGQLPLDRPGPLELVIIGAVGFLPVAAIWLAAKLWRAGVGGRPGT